MTSSPFPLPHPSSFHISQDSSQESSVKNQSRFVFICNSSRGQSPQSLINPKSLPRNWSKITSFPALLQGLTCLEKPKIPPLARVGVLLPGWGFCRLGLYLGPGDPSPEESSVSGAEGEARVREGTDLLDYLKQPSCSNREEKFHSNRKLSHHSNLVARETPYQEAGNFVSSIIRATREEADRKL